MCGRFTMTKDPRTVSEAFDVPDVPADLPPRYNTAPSQLVAVVGLKPDGTTRGLTRLRWGFVPSWAADPNSGPKPINAKVESVALKAPFKDAFRSKRCLVTADGFYEWMPSVGGKKQPYHFRLKTGGLFAFAGVWDVWKKPGRPTLHTCALITVPANEIVRPVHDRMPAVLLPDKFGRWLEPSSSVPTLLSLLGPLPAELLEGVPVGPAVSRVMNDGPECLSSVA